MDNEAPVTITGILKTGHKIPTMEAFAFEQNATGWEFITYPERRGFKTLVIVKADAIAQLSITAPEQMFESYKRAEQVPAVYPAGDPQHTAPSQMHLSAANRLRTAEGANRTMAIPDKDAPPGMGRPMSVVPVYDAKGNQTDMPVMASMIKL